MNQAGELQMNINMAKYANPEPVGTLNGNNNQTNDLLTRMMSTNWTDIAGQLSVIQYSYGDNAGQFSPNVPFTYYKLNSTSSLTPSVTSIPAGTLLTRIQTNSGNQNNRIISYSFVKSEL